VQVTPRPFRFIFGVRFRSEEALAAFIPHWEATSRIIQQEPGACGTKLHRLQGELAVLAIAEWTSKEARDNAFIAIEKKYHSAHPVRQSNSQFGDVFIVGNADEICTVML
jgi:hypothetical protein